MRIFAVESCMLDLLRRKRIMNITKGHDEPQTILVSKYKRQADLQFFRIKNSHQVIFSKRI